MAKTGKKKASFMLRDTAGHPRNEFTSAFCVAGVGWSIPRSFELMTRLPGCKTDRTQAWLMKDSRKGACKNRSFCLASWKGRRKGPPKSPDTCLETRCPRETLVDTISGMRSLSSSFLLRFNSYESMDCAIDA